MVAVTRGIKDLQLKNEMKKQPYKNIYQSIKSIIESEGWRGLQKGLNAQLAFQFCKFYSLRMCNELIREKCTSFQA